MSEKSMYDEVIDDVTGLGYDFRINDLDESLEVLFEGKWQRINDTIEAIIELRMRMLGYGKRNVKDANLTAMKQSWIMLAHKQRYNPLKDYFHQQATKYKSQVNEAGKLEAYYIPMLADHIENPDGMLETWLFRWMVGAVAKVFEGARNPMLVLASEQRRGKSYLSRWLCPIKDRFFRGPIKPDNKDDRLKLTNILIWEADELGATTRRSDVEALKSFLTLDDVHERPPFGTHPIHKRANTSFIGTVNPSGAGFLNDPTGSTRFLVSYVDNINFAYSQNLDVDDLWSEASWFYFNAPDSWKLTLWEEEQQQEINSEFETTSALLDLIEGQFEITENEAHFMTTWDIKQIVVEAGYRITNEQAFYNELGRTMRKLNCKKGKLTYSEGGNRGYHGIRKREGKKLDF